mmetsp:Transcript_32741/g.60154  ORF Transcript_32741/g.60154 Transcript_32741/m.60154 type:complete len:620 (+) Transcript_32741:180-2039(+)
MAPPESTAPELEKDTTPCQAQDDESKMILQRVQDIAKELGLHGSVEFFGSYASGLRTANSDMDIVYIPSDENGKSEHDTPVMILQRFAERITRHGFHLVVTVFQAAIPILKAVEPSGKDVDLCVGNRLGLYNSRLLAAYCSLDPRVAALGHRVKQWAHYYELIGSSDGHLNSYGYSLLVIFYLMHTSPPVVPNLQALADKDPPLVHDNRWGTDHVWECGFFNEVELMPKNNNSLSDEDLLIGFWEFYLQFKWTQHAVSVRLATQCGTEADGRRKFPDKFTGLQARVAREQWYVEDPFDLGHNLAAKCTPAGRRRIWESMKKIYDGLSSKEVGNMLAAFDELCPRKVSCPAPEQSSPDESHERKFLLKCRVHQKKVSSDAFASAFSDFTVNCIHFPQNSPWPEDRPEAFIEFPSDLCRKQAHTINESYVSGWQLRLFVCSPHALEDAVGAGAKFEKIPGWRPGSATNNVENGISRNGTDHEDHRRSRFGKGRRERPSGRDSAEKQKQRVREGIEQADALDELNTLKQRAQALKLDREARQAEQRIRALRDARSGGLMFSNQNNQSFKLDREARHSRGGPRSGGSHQAGQGPRSGGNANTAPGGVSKNTDGDASGSAVQFQ